MRFIVFIVCLSYAQTTLAIQCPANWTRLESFCLLNLEEEGHVSFDASRENCRNLGADLISVQTAQKARLVQQWLNRTQTLINVDIWLRDRIDAPGFNLSVWERDVSGGDWQMDEYAYAGILGTDEKKCLVFRLTFRDLEHVKWNKKKCMFGQTTVCEINSSQVLTINTTFLFTLMLIVAIFTNKYSSTL